MPHSLTTEPFFAPIETCQLCFQTWLQLNDNVLSQNDNILGTKRYRKITNMNGNLFIIFSIDNLMTEMTSEIADFYMYFSVDSFFSWYL